MLKTNPWHPLDWVLWPLLRLIWEKWLKSRKTSHFWHWRRVAIAPTETLIIEGDPEAMKITGRLSNFLGTNFSWEKVVILEALINESFHLGIRTQSDRGGKGTQLLCSIVLKAGTHFGVLIGAEDVGFYASTVKRQIFVPVRKVGEASRSTLPPDILLL